ncbi:MAG: hypothetical protein KDC88_12835 [Ignavibacteriae bacterium]|nr:hypothetical protein [Ignavibacteriota bacterium]
MNLISHLDDNDLVLLKFSKSETNTILSWEHSKEFEFNEIMYDVIKSKEVGDSVLYWCWQDNDETYLNKRFKENLANALQNDGKSNRLLSQLSNYLSIFYTTESNKISHNNSFYTIKYFSQNIKFYQSIVICPNSPPPNC